MKAAFLLLYFDDYVRVSTRVPMHDLKGEIVRLLSLGFWILKEFIKGGPEQIAVSHGDIFLEEIASRLGKLGRRKKMSFPNLRLPQESRSSEYRKTEL